MHAGQQHLFPVRRTVHDPCRRRFASILVQRLKAKLDSLIFAGRWLGRQHVRSGSHLVPALPLRTTAVLQRRSDRSLGFIRMPRDSNRFVVGVGFKIDHVMQAVRESSNGVRTFGRRDRPRHFGIEETQPKVDVRDVALRR